MMKKLMVAAFAVMAMVGGAQAEKTYGLLVNAYVDKYAAKDASPDASKYGFYTLYAMKQADVQAAMGRTTTVTYSDVATWLGENFAENRKAVAENGQAFSAWGKNSTQYKFSDRTGSYDWGESAKDAIGVYLYDDGTSVAYNVFANGTTSGGEIVTTYFRFEPDYSSASGWQAASVPEPTSGLLLLLGMAGLALKRKRVVG